MPPEVIAKKLANALVRDAEMSPLARGVIALRGGARGRPRRGSSA